MRFRRKRPRQPQAPPAGRAAHPVHRARVDERAKRGVRVQAAAQLQLAHALGGRLHERVVHAGLPRAAELRRPLRGSSNSGHACRRVCLAAQWLRPRTRHTRRPAARARAALRRPLLLWPCMQTRLPHERIVHAALPRARMLSSGGRCAEVATVDTHADSFASRPWRAHWGKQCVCSCTAAESVLWSSRSRHTTPPAWHVLGPGPAGRQATARFSAALARHNHDCCQLARPHQHDDQLTSTVPTKAHA